MFVAGVELRLRETRALSPVAGGEIEQADIAQRPAADRLAVDPVGTGLGKPLVGVAQRPGERGGDIGAGALARRMDRLDGDDRHLFGQVHFARQRQGFRGESRVARRVGQGLAHRRDDIGVERRHRRTAAAGLDALEQHPGRDLLPGIPAGHRVGIVDREKLQPVERHAAQLDRRREIAQQRRHRRGRHVGKAEHLALVVGHQHAGAGLRLAFAVEPGRQLVAVRPQQPHRDRDRHRLLFGLPRGRRHALLDREFVGARRRGRSVPRP